MVDEIKEIYLRNSYLITVALTYKLITALAIFSHIKFRKLLGNWSKVILASIVVVNSIHFYLRIRIMSFENRNRKFTRNPEFASLIMLKA